MLLLKPEPSPSIFVLMPLAAKARLLHRHLDLLSARAAPERGMIRSVSENERAISASPCGRAEVGSTLQQLIRLGRRAFKTRITHPHTFLSVSQCEQVGQEWTYLRVEPWGLNAKRPSIEREYGSRLRSKGDRDFGYSSPVFLPWVI